jgi:hypothetical protein
MEKVSASVSGAGKFSQEKNNSRRKVGWPHGTTFTYVASHD